MKWRQFIIVIIINVILLYPVVHWITSQARVVTKIKTVTQQQIVNVNTHDSNDFGGAVMVGDNETNPGQTLREQCPAGVKVIDTNPAPGKEFLTCK